MNEERTNLTVAILAELTTIKRLMVFQLLENGASQRQLAEALGVNQSQISRMFPRASSGKGN
jgi:IS30 family transposase